VIVISAAAAALMYAVKATGTLRIDPELELEGLDLAEHGTVAYHMEFGLGMRYSTPTGGSRVGALIGAPSDGGDASEPEPAEAPA
jgi:hypothetical protein